jgi:hypothetical protein
MTRNKRERKKERRGIREEKKREKCGNEQK